MPKRKKLNNEVVAVENDSTENQVVPVRQAADEPIKSLPSVLEQLISSYLPISEMAKLLQLNKAWKASLTVLMKDKEIEFLYPERLIKALGGVKKVFELPILDLGNNTGKTDYLDFVRPPMMFGAKIKRGQDAKKRPFISIAAIDSDDLEEGVLVQTLFQREYGKKLGWNRAGKFIVDDDPDGGKINYEYLNRLYRGEGGNMQLTDQLEDVKVCAKKI